MTRIALVVALLLLVPVPIARAADIASTASRPSASLVLPTGERLQVTSPADHARVVQHRGEAAVTVVRLGARTLLLPREVFGQLGRLDLRLFDAGELAAHAGQIPVVLTGTATTVAGVTITSRSNSSAHGFITPSSAARFGAAVRAGLPGVQRLSLDVAPAARPAYPQVSLDVKILSPAGVTPVDTLLLVVNTDDERKANLGYGVVGDDQRISVPKGHYSFIALTFTGTKTDGLVARYGFTTDVTVSTDDQTAVVDTSTATRDAYPTFVAPRPARLASRDIAYAISDDRGVEATSIDNPDFGDGTAAILAPRVDGGAHGKLTSVAWATLVGTGAGEPYRYYLSRAHRNAIVPAERVSPAAADLATVRVYSYTDGRTLDLSGGRAALFSYLDPGGFILDDLPDAPVRTEYLATDGGVRWISDNEQDARDGSAGRAIVGLPQALPAGRTVREDLFRGPLAPAAVSQPGFARTDCQACRSATQLLVGLTNYTDTVPSHVGLLFSIDPPELQVTIRRDGRQVFSSAESFYAFAPAVLDVPAGEHGYDVVADHDGTVTGQRLSIHARTEWRFRSSATSGAAAPEGWTCGTAGAGGCTVLPMLTVSDPLPTSVRGTLAAGTSQVVVTVAAVEGARGTRALALAYGVAVSGHGYVPQHVQALGGGRFLVTLNTPRVAPGTAMNVHLHAIDSAGGSIDQTVQNAYTVAGS